MPPSPAHSSLWAPSEAQFARLSALNFPNNNGPGARPALSQPPPHPLGAKKPILLPTSTSHDPFLEHLP